MLKIGMLIVFCWPLLLGAKPQGGDERLNELDRIVENPGIYEQQKEDRIAAIKRERAETTTPEQLYRADSKLVNEYKIYIADSALHYAREQLAIAREADDPLLADRANLEIAEIMTITGMYAEALVLLDSVGRPAPAAEWKGYYYHLYNTLYTAMRDYAVDRQDREAYERMANRYRDSLLSLYSEATDTHILVEAEQLISRGKYRQALEVLLPYYATLESDSREMGYTAYAVADAYRQLGEREKERDYLTVSALADLKSGVKEYISLRRLAALLYEEGDVRRAYAYMKRAMEDAVFCNARLRTIEISQVLPIIDKAYRLQTERQKRQIVVSLLVISVLAVFLVILVFYLRKQMKRLDVARREVGEANERLKVLNEELQDVNTRLSESNTCLQETNKNLAEVNYIKEAYIGRFLDLCSTYIGKLDTYRRSLNKKAMNGQTEELFRELKSTQLVENELEEFYTNFDTAFLRLFPDFVTEFNALLAEGEEISLKPGELLNTELRIFALIRLGITDSNKIAQFLRYSLKTIYNYRTKMRNKARGLRDDFEKEVMRIGTF